MTSAVVGPTVFVFRGDGRAGVDSSRVLTRLLLRPPQHRFGRNPAVASRDPPGSKTRQSPLKGGRSCRQTPLISEEPED